MEPDADVSVAEKPMEALNADAVLHAAGTIDYPDKVRVLARIDDSNRYYVTDVAEERSPDGERFLVLDLSHASNWHRAAPVHPRGSGVEKDS